MYAVQNAGEGRTGKENQDINLGCGDPAPPPTSLALARSDELVDVDESPRAAFFPDAL
jgi:hypothetical protein